MNALAFLASQGKQIPLHPVIVRLVDPADPAKVGDAPAVLRFVSDQKRLTSQDAATVALGDKAVSQARRQNEEAYHFLVEAIRQEGGVLPLFETVTQAKSCMVESEATRLWGEYQRYIDTHFPASLTPAEAKRIADDARNFTVADLLTSYGYWQILRALPSLAVASGASLTFSFSPTPSAST